LTLSSGRDINAAMRRFKMCAETEEKKEQAACCDPGAFGGMFEMMGKCFTGKRPQDCSAIMEAMKKSSCFSPKTEETKKDCRG
jgi:hypothetical protein